MTGGQKLNGSFTRTVKPPISLAHVVLRTTPSNFSEMVSFYCDFLGAHVVYKNDFFGFMTYDEEHHRIAVVAAPDTAPKMEMFCGLQHIAFSYASLEDLAMTYTQRKSLGIETKV